METIEQQFQKFYENIKLTPAQKQDAIDKYTGVCKKLHDYYYPNVEYNGSTKLLIGSYGKHTSIRPARDVDVIFVMPEEKFFQYDDNTSNKQSQLLQDIKRILKEKYPNTPISADGKIVKVEFSETKHDVELVPAWENNDGSFKIPDSENGGSWVIQRYREEIKVILDSDTTTGKTKFLIRCIKKWSENCSANLKSFQIEKIVLSFFSGQDFSDLNNSSLVKEFFTYFYQNTTDENLKSHLKTASNRADKACDFEQDDKLDNATDEWKKIFGGDFPKSESSTSKNIIFNEQLDSLQKKYPSADEDYIDRYCEVKLNPHFFVKIDTYIPKIKGFRAGWLSDLMKFKLFTLIRKISLSFKVVNCNVPEPYEIKWKVRNFGDEARDADDLRGEISSDKRLKEKIENTKYIGQHYVECYIIKDNKCVAMGHTPVPIGND